MIYLAATATLRIDEQKCTGCGVCIDVCPREVLRIRDHKASITDIDLCIECGACSLNCRYNAIEVDSGVGCASALIGSLKSGGAPTCGCDDDKGGGCC